MSDRNGQKPQNWSKLKSNFSEANLNKGLKNIEDEFKPLLKAIFEIMFGSLSDIKNNSSTDNKNVKTIDLIINRIDYILEKNVYLLIDSNIDNIKNDLKT